MSTNEQPARRSFRSADDKRRAIESFLLARNMHVITHINKLHDAAYDQKLSEYDQALREINDTPVES